MIEGHFAKANPHWKSLAGHETLVVFSGPHSYVSPTLYIEELSVPTWNYIAVHAYGMLELVEDERRKDALLAGLIQSTNPPTPERWRAMPDRLPPHHARRHRRLPHPHRAHRRQIQNQPEPRRHQNAPTSRPPTPPALRDQQALAAWMQRLIQP